jgi:multidrug efflux pump subunit AcrA (membrane-fusion protein)
MHHRAKQWAFMWVFVSAPFGVHASGEPIEAESVVLQLLDEAQLAAGQSGLVVHLSISEGNRVKRGDVIARIDDSAARIAEQGAKAELAVAQGEVKDDVTVRFAKKALEVAKSELARSLELVKQSPRSVSQTQIDIERLKVEELELEIERAELELELAALRVHVAEAKVEAAQLEIRRRQIVAPIDAVVVEVIAKVGEWVEPGQRMVRLVSTRRLKAEGFVTAADAAEGIEGREVEVTLEEMGAKVGGKIVFVSPEIDPVNKQVRVWAEVDNPDGVLRPGQTVEMQISRP